MPTIKDHLIDIVNRIPKRRVASFGQIAPILSKESGKRITAQVVGWLLSWMPEHERTQLCRRRVVNKVGFISSMKLWEKGIRQKHLLEAEGIPIVDNQVDMDIYRVDDEQLEMSNE